MSTKILLAILAAVLGVSAAIYSLDRREAAAEARRDLDEVEARQRIENAMQQAREATEKANWQTGERVRATPIP